MRPERLSVQAFGPYVKPLTLRFDLLPADVLLLLCGNTGAGKTMLLDAICNALFGECTGAVRDPRLLRSHHAAATLESQVELEFTVGHELYRVRRTLEYERPKKRGDGTTKVAATAFLWRLRDGEEPAVIAAQPLVVRAAVESILGFTAAQFRQVVVLPQGEFQKFLQGGSQEREAILEVLFQTSPYKRIEEVLKENARRRQEAAAAQLRERDELLRQAGVATVEEVGLRAEAASAELAQRTAELVVLREQLASADRERQAAIDADKRLRERSAAESAYDVLAAGGPAIDAKRGELEAAQRAAEVRPAESEWQRAKAQAVADAKAAADARAEALRAAANRESCEAALVREQGREAERDAAVRAEIDLAGMLERLAGFEQSASSVRAAETERKRQAGIFAQVDTKLRDAKTRIGELEAAAAALEPVAIEAPRAEAALQEVERLHERHSRLAAARLKAKGYSDALAEAARQTAEAEAKLEGARRAAADVEERWIGAQAAVLAASLRADCPCPVCGSVVHPAPADGGADVPDEAARKRAKKAQAEAEAALDRARSAQQGAQQVLDKEYAGVELLERELGPSAALPPAEFDAARARAAADVKGCAAAASALAAARRDLSAARVEYTGLEPLRAKAEAALREAGERAEAARSVHEERAAQIPETRRDHKSLDAELERARQLTRSLRAALERAQQATAAARDQASAADAKATALAGTAHERAVAAEARRAAFEAALVRAKFADEGAWRVAMRTEEFVRSAAAEISTHEQTLAAAHERLVRARDAAAGLVTPDLERAEANCAAARAAVEAVVRAETELAGKVEAFARFAARLSEIAVEAAAAERRHGIAQRLANAACGKNSLNLALQRYVQIAQLERVLEAATLRLRRMSRDRYHLHVAGGVADGRSHAGLDLEVFDTNTGKLRRVSTLSGGESFLAALALALGLSDAVQNLAGGVRLESIFIDEGFGTLDPETLELTMDTLRDLRQGGRMVGLVSHVPELRDQIEARLEVTPSRGGSTARLMLAGRKVDA